MTHHPAPSLAPTPSPAASTPSAAADAAAVPELPPLLLVGRREACRRAGVSLTTWKRWQRAGRVRWGGRWGGPVPAPQGRQRLYAAADLDRLAEELRQLGEPYPDPDPDRPGCYRVPLVGYLGEREAVVDAESLPVVAGRRWALSERGDVYAGQVLLSTATRADATQMKREILGLPPGGQWRISHANGDPLDCRRANLVVRTPSEQGRGARKLGSVSGRTCTSRFKGVTWEQSRSRWRVMIATGGEHRFLGRFRDELAAAEAYDEAARELFGEHARLNFPDGLDAAPAHAAAA